MIPVYEYFKFLKEKSDEIASLKEEYEKIIKEKEEQFRNGLKQRQDDLEKQHKQEVEGLTQEWNVDRRVKKIFLQFVEEKIFACNFFSLFVF